MLDFADAHADLHASSGLQAEAASAVPAARVAMPARAAAAGAPARLRGPARRGRDRRKPGIQVRVQRPGLCAGQVQVRVGAQRQALDLRALVLLGRGARAQVGRQRDARGHLRMPMCSCQARKL